MSLARLVTSRFLNHPYLSTLKDRHVLSERLVTGLRSHFRSDVVCLLSHCANKIGIQFDRHMLPIVCILYVLSYLDRGNIGNAKTAGIQEELSLDDQDWTWILQGFYISYVLFEWTQLFWKLFPAHIYIAILCFLSVAILGLLTFPALLIDICYLVSDLKAN